jgi:dihydrolipoamide dehydrogenase
MLVVGAGATGMQVASIFNAFGSRVQLFEAGRRILATEDADISAAAAVALRQSGIAVHETFSAIEAFERTADGVRMIFTKDGRRFDAEATLVVVAVGWVAETSELNVAAAGIELNSAKVREGR